jgi:hypothetical protein
MDRGRGLGKLDWIKSEEGEKKGELEQMQYRNEERSTERMEKRSHL